MTASSEQTPVTLYDLTKNKLHPLLYQMAHNWKE